MKKTSPFISAFLELLQAGLWGNIPNSRLFEHLTPVMWRDLLTLSLEQATPGIAFEGILRLPETHRPPAPIMEEWQGLYQIIHTRQIHMESVRNELLSGFREAGIRCALFKGDTVGMLYPISGSRLCGDIDLWLPDAGDQARALSYLKSRRVSVKPPGRHEISFNYQGVSVELHDDLFNLPFSTRLNDKPLLESNHFPGFCPSDEATTILLLTHAARHFLEMGLGFRHLCDWAVWLHNKQGTEGLVKGLKEIRRLGASRFLDEFTALAIEALHLKLADEDSYLRSSRPSLQNRLLEELFYQGNLGHNHSRQKKQQKGFPLRYYYKATMREISLFRFWPRFIPYSIYGHIKHQISSLKKGI